MPPKDVTFMKFLPFYTHLEKLNNPRYKILYTPTLQLIALNICSTYYGLHCSLSQKNQILKKKGSKRALQYYYFFHNFIGRWILKHQEKENTVNCKFDLLSILILSNFLLIKNVSSSKSHQKTLTMWLQDSGIIA